MIKAVFVLFLAGVIAGVGMTHQRWEGQAPQITFDRDFKALGRNPTLGLTVNDSGSGLKHVTVRLRQNNEEIILADDSFGRGKDKSRTYDVGKLITEKYKIQEGPAILTVAALDYAFRNFGHGNQTDLTKEFTVHLYPPRLEVLEGQHYINQGGTECVVYRVSDNAVVSGVQVGSEFFPGFPLKSDKNLRFALFAFKYDLPANTPVKVIARDSAGNEAIAGFWQKVFPKSFRSRDIPLEDSFVQKVVPEIIGQTPDTKDQGDLVKTFVEINNNLRKKNHDTIAKLAAQSPGQFLWNGAFLQLSNSKVESAFADRRTYLYNGKAVDQQDHVGFDLSVVQHYPIEAANDGKVVLAEYFGIYGNTVLIDHGAGLISLYGHLSEIAVQPGQMVKKTEVVGKSGATGLAAGDHLHFGLFLHGVPVNPTEWWDEKWIKDHVLGRLRV
jgi:murein DD-endopeptidase MepM/ murein hydrolase activator NlpD